MDQEVNELIKFISSSEKLYRFNNIFKQEKKEEFFTKTTMFSGIIAAVLLIIDFNTTLSLLALLVFLFSSVIFILLSSVSIRRSFFMPLNEYFELFNIRMKQKEEYISKLNKFSVHALKAVKKGMETDLQQLQNRTSFLVGSIKKVGLFPAFIAIFLASFQFSEKISPNFSNILIALIVGMYLGVFLIQKLSNSLELQILFLNESIEYKLSLEGWVEE